jgi:hypothetical protein
MNRCQDKSNLVIRPARFIAASLLLLAFAAALHAQVGGGQFPLTCTSNVTSTPQLRSESFADRTGDIAITCTGGAALFAGTPLPTVNLTAAWAGRTFSQA